MRAERRVERNVIPRWRPLAAIERVDIGSAGRFESRTHINQFSDFADHLAIWRKDGDLAAASDILDAFFLTGDIRLLNEASRITKKNGDQLPPRLKQALETAYRPESDPLSIRRIIASRETDEGYVRASIRILKMRLRDFPRDALSYLEIARLYTVLGQFKIAETALQSARRIAPNDRFIIRASLQFYDIVGALEHGLAIVRASDRLSFDPWIQSAEIATATLLGKHSRVADHRLIKLGPDGSVTRERTELAMAMATLDRASGLRERKIFQQVRQALPHSTENGFAQAVWLSDNSSRDFLDRFPDVEPGNEAYEAKVQLAIEQRDFETAVGFAFLWLEDQPFSIEAIIEYLNLSSVHTKPTGHAVSVAKRSMDIYADNWHVLNGCTLVLTEARDFELAKIAVERLGRAAPHDVSRAFVEAAKGFLAFAAGDFIEGRLRYENAAQIAVEKRRYDLVVDCAMFWLRCEAGNDLLNANYISIVKEQIERGLKRVDSSHRQHLQSVWFSVQPYLTGEERNLSIDVSLKLQEVVSSRLDDPDLFLIR